MSVVCDAKAVSSVEGVQLLPMIPIRLRVNIFDMIKALDNCVFRL